MPQHTHPGVYVQEVPGGARTIAGVPTSITAFVGGASAGPTDRPVTLSNFAAFERTFGGLDLSSPMSYAVRDYFVNGGRIALVVRVLHHDATAATIRLHGDRKRPNGLVLAAMNRGAWGNRLSAAVDHDTDVTPTPGAPVNTRFNLSVRYRRKPGINKYDVERFGSVSTDPADVRYLPLVLERESALVRVHGAMPDERPASNVNATRSRRVVQWVDAGVDSGSDGTDIHDDDVIGDPREQTGMYALDRTDVFNLLCIPPRARDVGTLPSTYTLTAARVYQAALELCVRRRAMLIVDPDPAWAAPRAQAIAHVIAGRNALGMSGPQARNAAIYFPCVRQPDPLRHGEVDTFAPSGCIAGVIARTDVQRGVWKSPAGLEATLLGVHELQVNASNVELEQLNPLGINALRSMGTARHVIWGARTLAGADASADEYKYVPVRRLALFIEESLSRGTQWVVFEPNDEPLWAQVRQQVGAFLHDLFRHGAFQGTTPREAYFVTCDRTTISEDDIAQGIVNIVVGFAPLKPAEFVVVTIRHSVRPTSV